VCLCGVGFFFFFGGGKADKRGVVLSYQFPF
jgi:hypothetical protein